MKLHDTIHLMASPDYKDRFLAEFWQLQIRKEKLDALIAKHEEGELDFTPSCPIPLLKDQSKVMQEYIEILNIRAEIEGISLLGRETEVEPDQCGTEDDPNLYAFWEAVRAACKEIVNEDCTTEAKKVTMGMFLTILRLNIETTLTAIGKAAVLAGKATGKLGAEKGRETVKDAEAETSESDEA